MTEPPTQRQHDERRVQLAHRISEVENIPFLEASRLIPDDPEELRKLVDRLNARHGGPGSPDERKIGRANARARKENTSFSEAARKTK